MIPEAERNRIEHERLMKEYVEAKKQEIAVSQRLAAIEAEEAAEAAARAVPRPFIAAVPPMMPPPGGWTRPQPAPPVGRVHDRPIYTAADFPRAVNVRPPVLAAPNTVPFAEAIHELTTANAVRNGDYAANRERLLGMVQGALPSGHYATEGGVFSLGSQQTPTTPHPMTHDHSMHNFQRARPSTEMVQPHGHRTGPPTALMQAKLDRSRTLKKAGLK